MRNSPIRHSLALAYGLAAASLLLVQGEVLAQQTYASTTLTARAIQIASQPPAGPQWGQVRGGYIDQSDQLQPVVSSSQVEYFGYGSSDGGYANALALAWAQAGAVGASAAVEVQARAQVNSYAGGDGSAAAKAYFNDLVTFSAPSLAPGTLLKVSGELLLTGDAYSDRASVSVRGAGTGLNLQQPNNGWKLFCTTSCTFTDAYSNRSDWVTGTPIHIPYLFYVVNGQAASLEYSIDIAISALVTYDPCVSFGGLCTGAQFDDKRGVADFGHTLAWGGATVTTQNGGAVGTFTALGLSGFDYTQPYAAVPEPAAWAMMLAGLMFVLRRGSRGSGTAEQG